MPKFPLKMLYQVATTYRMDITGRRLLNMASVLFSMGISRVLRRPVVWGYPVRLMVEPTNFCNLRCPMCPSGNGDLTRARGRMDLPAYERLLDEIGPYIWLMLFWNQGEPFIHKDFLAMVKLAKARGIATMTSTNGHFFRTTEDVDAIIQSGLDEIIISLDGTNQESYAKYRVGGDFETVLNGIELLIERKRALKSRRPLVNLQFIVFKHNQTEIETVKAIGERLQVDRLSLKTAQIYSDAQGVEFLPDDDHFRRYEHDGDHFRMKLKPQNWCKVLWFNSVVNWDGSVAPCCFDKDGDFAYANAFESPSFRAIWQGRASQQFRQRILQDRSQLAMCANCFEGMKGAFVDYSEVRLNRFDREN